MKHNLMSPKLLTGQWTRIQVLQPLNNHFLLHQHHSNFYKELPPSPFLSAKQTTTYDIYCTISSKFLLLQTQHNNPTKPPTCNIKLSSFSLWAPQLSPSPPFVFDKWPRATSFKQTTTPITVVMKSIPHPLTQNHYMLASNPAIQDLMTWPRPTENIIMRWRRLHKQWGHGPSNPAIPVATCLKFRVEREIQMLDHQWSAAIKSGFLVRLWDAMRTLAKRTRIFKVCILWTTISTSNLLIF